MTELDSKSQAGQDRFVYQASGFRTDGRFLDLGCNDPVVHSNTWALEQIGWTGLRVDVGDYAYGRSSPFLRADATHRHPAIVDFCRRPVDYLSLDIDTYAVNAMEWLLEFEFGIITVEHDLYRVGAGVRDHLRAILRDRYDLVRPDVVAPGYGPFEDWYVDRGYRSPEQRDALRVP